MIDGKPWSVYFVWEKIDVEINSLVWNGENNLSESITVIETLTIKICQLLRLITVIITVATDFPLRRLSIKHHRDAKQTPRSSFILNDEFLRNPYIDKDTFKQRPNTFIITTLCKSMMKTDSQLLTLFSKTIFSQFSFSFFS